MAATKKPQKLLEAGKWHPSLRRLVIFASLALNVGFVVVLVTLSTTTVLDGLFMPVALDRYCSTANDNKFQKEDAQIKALRAYVCDRSDAHEYFQDGYMKYLKSLNIPTTAASAAE
jgi:hypothetical protein